MFIIFRGVYGQWSYTGHSLRNYYYAEYVALKKKKIPFPHQISREGTDEKHMSFFVWPNITFIKKNSGCHFANCGLMMPTFW